MAEFARIIGDMRGTGYAPIKFEISDDLSRWSAEIPGKVVAKAETLAGSMTPPGKQVQTVNAPGSETGPGTVATWGKAINDEVDAMVSNGNRMVGQASIFRLTGVAHKFLLFSFRACLIEVVALYDRIFIIII